MLIQENYIGDGYLKFTNGRSLATINTRTGLADPSRTKISPEDQEAFARLLHTIRLAATP
jgi:hypothetical protein